MQIRITSITLALVIGLAVQAGAQTTGRVLEDTGGSFLFVPDSGTFEAVPLELDAGRGQALTQMPSIVLQGETPGDISRLLERESLVQEVQLPSLTVLSESSDLLGASRYDGIREAAQALDREVENSLTGTAMSSMSNRQPVLRDRTNNLGEETTRAILAALAAPDASVGEVNSLIELAAAIEEDLQELGSPPEDLLDLSEFQKSIYAGSREYPPHIYRRIANNTQGVVGIGERLGPGAGYVPPHCSGALIGPSVVLTARHCLYAKQNGVIRPRSIGNLRIVFDFEIDPAFPITRKEVSVARLVAEGSVNGAGNTAMLDYALLEIAEAPDASIVWRVPDQVAVIETNRQICLITLTLHREQEIYVVGHPQSRARTVADAGTILFPFRVDEAAYGDLTRRVLNSLHHAAEADGADEDRLLELFRRWTESYVEEPPGSGTYIYNSAHFGGQPTIGIRANTYGGNSGGPVFSKLYNHMVGVFRGGQFDFQKTLVAGWEHHEGALPVELVIEDLNARAPGWQKEFKVCAWGVDNEFALWSGDPALLDHCNNVCR